MKHPSQIERLEARIAPASLLTYIDIDGDKVSVTSSAGDLTGHATITGGKLTLLDLSDSSFNHANLAVSVTRAGNGDGLTTIGRINGGTNDFGTIVIKGDLGDIDAGAGAVGETAVKSLSVRSMGSYGTATGSDLVSLLKGSLGSLKVTGDLKNATLGVIGDSGFKIGSVSIGGSLSGTVLSDGSIGPVKVTRDIVGGSLVAVGGMGNVTVGGSVLGGTDTDSGRIQASGAMGAVKIGGDLVGGDNARTGMIGVGGHLTSLTIGGSVRGGTVINSGEIITGGTVGAIKIGRDLLGASSTITGLISGSGTIASITIGGSVVGVGNLSGAILNTADILSIKIGGNLVGGSVSGSASISQSGYIESTGRIGSVTIGGSVITGLDNSSGSITKSASIHAGNDIGALTVKGNLIGHTTASGNTPVIFSASGQAFPTATSNLAFGKISIGGNVERALILGGYSVGVSATNTASAAVNGNAQIGPVSVTGDWIASSLVSGVRDTNANGFGDAGDTLIPGGTTAKIASVTIKGILIGSLGTAENFGFESHLIGTFKANGVTIPTATPISLSPLTTNGVTIRLV